MQNTGQTICVNPCHLWLTYTYGNTAITNFATIGKDIKTVDVYFIVMKTNGVAVVKDEIVERDMRVTKERAAQANIKVNAIRLDDFDAPPLIAPSFTNWVAEYLDNNEKPRLTAETKAIIDAANPSRHKNCLIYVPSPLRLFSNLYAGGIAIAEYHYKDEADKPYLHNAFVAKDDGTMFTPAHELVHNFGVSNHVSQAQASNLMRDGGTSTENTIFSSKRLTPQQIETIRSKIP
jgi:hypothetical protein